MCALVDDADYEMLTAQTWYRKQGRNTWYATTASDCGIGFVYMHRLILTAPPKLEVDHRDGNGLNNQRDNLRVCTRGQNARNCRGNSALGVKGVTLNANRERPWSAKIGVDYKTIHLGDFPSLEEAAHAYDAAAIQYFGEFARLNFPTEECP